MKEATTVTTQGEMEDYIETLRRLRGDAEQALDYALDALRRLTESHDSRDIHAAYHRAVGYAEALGYDTSHFE